MCVCVWIKVGMYEMYVCSVYCQFSMPVEPMLAYMRRVVNIARGKPLLIYMDGNAVSSAWYSKYVSRSRACELKSEKIMEFVGECSLHVLNEVSENYTYSGPAGDSNIDISLGNDKWLNFVCEWKIERNWCISDHNMILLDVVWNESDGVSKLVNCEMR